MTARDSAASHGIEPLAAFRLDGKVVVLTGASAGLGARFADVLDSCGARLVLVARRLELLDEVASRCRDAMVVQCDLEDSGAIEGIVEQTLAHYGQIDVLVNNAGAASAKPALKDDLDDVKKLIAVDLVAPYQLSVSVARTMKERKAGGVIVNLASIVGLAGTARLPMGGYAAAKGGLISLTRELATQWGRYGIRVNALAPGWFESGMGQWVLGSPDFKTWIEERISLHRLGGEGELDGALLFLASAASSYVTGQTLVVDGGWSSD